MNVKRTILGAMAALLTATGVAVVAPGPLGAPAAAAVDPNLGPVAPAGETFCYAAADNGDRLAFIRMVGAPGDPGFSIQVDRLRLAIGRSNVEAIAIRPSGGIYAVDDASGSTPLGRIVPGEFDPTVDNDATTNPLARGDFSLIANLNRGGNLDVDVDGLTFIETDNLISSDDILLGSVRRSGNDTLVTIDPATGATSTEWAIVPPPELTTSPDTDGIQNITQNDIDDIAWDPESDIVYGVLGGGGLNYLGRLAWVVNDGSGEVTSATVPRAVGGAPDFSDLVRLEFVRIGSPAVNDVEGLGFSNVGATFGQFFGVTGANTGSSANNNRLLAFDKATGATTALINLGSDPAQGTGNGDYESVDCVQPVLPGSLTIGEDATPADGTRFTFSGGSYGAIGSGSSNDGLADGETELKTVNAGTYVITQDALPPEWSLDDIECTGDLGFGPADWSIDLGAGTLTVTVDAGQDVECTFFNSQTYGAIGDRVWLDEDLDGVQDAGETGINGVTVNLRDLGSGDIVATDVTSGDGDYWFPDVLPGSYRVELDPGSLPAAAVATYDLDGLASLHQAEVTLAADEVRDDLDFGYVLGAISIDKTVYAGTDGGASCPGLDTVGVESGDDLVWCFVVTNTGSAPLSDVTVTDPDLGIDQDDMVVVSGDLASMAPGAVTVLAYEAAATNDLDNTATATGDLSGGGSVTDDDDAHVTVLGPAVQIDKTVARGDAASVDCPADGQELVQGRPGDTVTYCFVVTNTGQTNLSAVTVTDPDLGIDAGDGLVEALLTPGQSATFEWETTVDGDLVNTASVVGTSPAGAQPTDDDTAEVDEVHPALEVRKTVELGDTDGAACPGVEETFALDGDTVTWCFEVQNTGDVELTDIRLDDPALLADETDMTVLSGSLASLAPGATVSLYLEGPASADLANTVTATGTPPVGADVTDDDGAAIDVIDPAVTIDKTVYAGHDGGASCEGGESVTGEPGAPVTWCFVVTNADDEGALFDLRIDDPALGVDETDLTTAGDLVDLAEGESVLLWYEGTIAGSLANTATVTATPPLGPDVTDDDDASVTEVVPAISLAKTVYEGHDGGAGCAGGELVEVESGTEVTWCFEVTNTGDTALDDVVVDDPDLGISLPVTDLAVGASATVFHEGTVTADLVNTAEAAGTSPAGTVVTDDDPAEVALLAPAVAIAKTVYRGHDAGAGCPGGETAVGRPGDAVTWCFAVTNTGDLALDLAIDDPALGITDAGMTVLSGSLSNVAPGDTVVLYRQDTVDGDLANVAEVTGTTPLGDEVTDDDGAAVDEIRPRIALSTTNYRGHDAGAGCEGDETSTGQAGEDLTYCWVITNTGDSPLTDVTLDDPDVGVTESGVSVHGSSTGSLASLAPGEFVVLYLPTTFSTSLANTASTTGTPLVGPDVADQDPSEVVVVDPAITVTNTVYRGHDGGASCEGDELVTDLVGTAVTYCFVVTNTGDTPLDVTLDDPALGIDETDVTVLSGSLSGLAPGDSVVVYLESTIGGDLANTVTATGTPAFGPAVTADDPSAVDAVDPSVSVDKTVYRGQDGGASCAGAELVLARPGDGVTYCFTVTNTGDAALDQITLDDADLGIDEGDMDLVGVGVAVLPPGDSITYAYEAAVDGDLVNTVTTTGRVLDGADAPIGGPNGTVTDDDDAEVDEVRPSLSVDKTVYGGHDGGASCAGAESFADEAGQPVTWCFTVTNTGDGALVDVVLDDPALGVDESDLTLVSGSLSTLAAGDSVTLYLEGTLDADLVNTVTASATPVVGPDVSDADDASVEVLVPGIALSKTVYRGHDGGASCEGGESVQARAGAAVTWCFLVTNTGEVPLDVIVDDDDLGFTDTVLDLAPGDEAVVFFEGTVAGDLVNVATARGTTPDGDEVDDDDGATVDEIDPGISVAKTISRGHDGGAGCPGGELVDDEVGVAVTWCFRIVNTGDVALADVTLDDVSLGVDEADVVITSGSLENLPVDGVITGYVQGEVERDLTNNVVVTATAPDGGDVSDADTARTQTVAPQIGVAKTVISAPRGNGDGTYDLTYRIRVSNAGETALEWVQVTDDLSATFEGVRSFRVLGVSSADLTVNPGYDGKASGSTELLAGTDRLDIGERGDIEVRVRVTPGSALGPHRNTAVAYGTSPNGRDVTDESDSGTNSDPTATNPDEPGDTGGTDDPVPVGFPQVDLTVDKSVAGTSVLGDGTMLVTWRLVVTNNGPGDDPGPITVTDTLEDRLNPVSAEGNGWICGNQGRQVTCVRNAALAADQTAPAITLVTRGELGEGETVTNDAEVASTVSESRTDNNTDGAEVTGQGATRPPGTLPRTGAGIGGLLLAGLALIAGGRLLRRWQGVTTGARS